ncbi:MAG: ferritin [Deltaproteobacteria bacterium]|nr:ferritin [Deltaproteobacteria bacterium]
MLTESMQQALNDQLNAELYSSYLYLSMAAHFQSADLAGMAHWMELQAQEELLHVKKYYDYINDRHGRVLLGAVKGPKTEWDSPLQVFTEALEHEKLVTSLINGLVDLAGSQKDHSTHNFLQWFVAEQVEEEATVAGIVGQLKIIKDNPGALFMVDRELTKRVVAPAI